MNERLLLSANLYVRGTKIDKDVQTHMRDVKNHIVRQYQLDEFGRAIEISMPELAIKGVQTDPLEEFATKQTEVEVEDAEEEEEEEVREGEDSLEKRTTEKSIQDEMLEAPLRKKEQSERKKETSLS